MTESNLGAIILLAVSILVFTPLGLSIPTGEHDIIKACILTIPSMATIMLLYVFFKPFYKPILLFVLFGALFFCVKEIISALKS